MTVRGHIRLFTLQMNREESRQMRNAEMPESICTTPVRNAAFSIQRVFLPSLKIASGR